MSIRRHKYRRLTGAEFKQLRIEAGITIRDFIFISGRKSTEITLFESEEPNTTNRWVPMMNDIVLLELIKRSPALQDIMVEIANDYSADVPANS